MKREKIPNNLKETESMNIAVICSLFVVILMTSLDFIYLILGSYKENSLQIWFKIITLVVLAIIMVLFLKNQSKVELVWIRINKTLKTGRIKY